MSAFSRKDNTSRAENVLMQHINSISEFEVFDIHMTTASLKFEKFELMPMSEHGW